MTFTLDPLERIPVYRVHWQQIKLVSQKSQFAQMTGKLGLKPVIGPTASFFGQLVLSLTLHHKSSSET